MKVSICLQTIGEKVKPFEDSVNGFLCRTDPDEQFIARKRAMRLQGNSATPPKTSPTDV